MEESQLVWFLSAIFSMMVTLIQCPHWAHLFNSWVSHAHSTHSVQTSTTSIQEPQRPSVNTGLSKDSIKEYLLCFVTNLKMWSLQKSVHWQWRDARLKKWFKITCLGCIKASSVTSAEKAMKDNGMTHCSNLSKSCGFHYHMMSVSLHVWRNQTTSNSQSRFWTVRHAAWIRLLVWTFLWWLLNQLLKRMFHGRLSVELFCI